MKESRFGGSLNETTLQFSGFFLNVDRKKCELSLSVRCKIKIFHVKHQKNLVVKKKFFFFVRWIFQTVRLILTFICVIPKKNNYEFGFNKIAKLAHGKSGVR